MAQAPRIVYNASKTLAQLHASEAFVRGVMGPIGSGKSVGCCMEILAKSLRQEKAPDGVARSRWAIIRNTYPELKSTTIKTWTEWVPEQYYGPVIYSSPIVHRVRLRPDVRIEVFFLALDRPDEIKKLLSLELTGGWINEAREVPKEVLDALTGRVGRYPPKRDGGATWSGVLLDTNPPDDMHWWYDFAEEDGWRRAEGTGELIPVDEIPPAQRFAFFRQPGGLSPQAENVENLPEGYYQRLMSGKSKEWINVYVHGKYGSIKEGKPVYEADWNDDFHVSNTLLAPIKGREIILGWDFGLTPACVIAQVTPFGQLRILDEVVGENIGLERFASGFVLPLLRTKYKDNPFVSVCDPSIKRAETDESTVLDVLDNIGIPTEPAPSNNELRRLEAVRYWLNMSRSGHPGLLLNKTCKVLRRGFNSGYAYKRMQVGGGTARYALKPEKNIFSHAHDGLQGICLFLQPDPGQSVEERVVQSSRTANFSPADSIVGY